MATPFQHLTIDTLERWLENDTSLTLVDIRDPTSFAGGHIPGSRHLDNDSVAALFEAAPRERPLVVVCYHGHSSQQAAAWLAGQGFSEVYSLDGGFSEWEYRLPGRVERGGP
ncbi:thiosulfate sulfurtransferase GlpE [Halomonas sp. MCCC 1A17488]|uniref:Thiosulfate sulfurtransferase GlpE n=1 Tax=Billgrantia sulfidoxydans TaxID=2733484 RepID=A0ABX7W0W8_9GAMM|nr:MULTISPECIES: thiosulfate sulfurtransferase GlpE [Halomonas]MCE8016304.1 thiosulfate sulfurtransferase GlpE [Halomonas sp. MCCC 1A17488]MCG3239637.1 thiosulfate sulfurtransferase GlpE [Halomonas sp. MCCC 1A17488]QPP50451.1 thiosulfate sulfurtransferase GlpE [Halomonas sp. SS10-MC5]QTP54068.1 thiosulfate sulfurtransferase GlpE [Halomonas sulfidoxydans]